MLVLMTLAEMAVAARMHGMSYGKYSYLLRQGVVQLPDMEEVRRAMAKETKKPSGRGKTCPVKQYDKRGNFITEWDNALQAAKAFGRDHASSIQAACECRYMSAYGYQWRYSSDEAPGEYQRIKTTAIVHKKPTEEKPCKHCGKMYVGVRNSRFCSRKCQIDSHKLLKKSERKMEQKTCRFCGKSFETDIPQKLYCSKECQINHNWKAQAARKKAQNRK